MRLDARSFVSLSACAMTLSPRATVPQLNLFGDIFDGEKLKEQTPYENPLLPLLIKKEAATYQLQEKLFSLSGEDFRVRDVGGNVSCTRFATFSLQAREIHHIPLPMMRAHGCRSLLGCVAWKRSDPCAHTPDAECYRRRCCRSRVSM
jgi:hypothetical protein